MLKDEFKIHLYFSIDFSFIIFFLSCDTYVAKYLQVYEYIYLLGIILGIYSDLRCQDYFL